MSQTMIVRVPVAEHDSYWLAVEVSTPGNFGSAGYPRAVVVAAAAGDAVREKAQALAAQFNVPVQDEPWPNVGPKQPPQPSGVAFTQRADVRLDPHFRQGDTDGRQQR